MYTNSFFTIAILTIAAASASAQVTPVPPAPGELVFSEVMYNPLCPADNDGEWFELTNVSGKVLDVNGLYFQDGAFPGANGDKYFQVLPTVATLPPMFPGDRFIFARSDNPTLNNGLPRVDYTYASTLDTAPADHSQVTHTGMNMGNSAVDGMHITIGAPAYLGGTVIDSFSYNPFASPISPSDGISVERIDLYQPMVVNGTANSSNIAPCALNANYGTCIPQERGTPGIPNSMDATTVWHLTCEFTDTLNQNSGTITVTTPLSNATGSVLFKNSGGFPFTTYTFGFAEAPAEIPLSLLINNNTGALLLDLNSLSFLYDSGDLNYYFDGNGEATLPVSWTPDPLLPGKFFYFQWLDVDFSQASPLLGSRMIRMYMQQ